MTELVKSRLNRGLRPNLLFYRNSAQTEIDVVIEKSGKVDLLEIKSSPTWAPSFSNAIHKVKSEFGDSHNLSWIVYDGLEKLQLESGKTVVIPLRQLATDVEKITVQE